MSWRQPVSIRAAVTKDTKERTEDTDKESLFSIRDSGHLPRIQGLQESSRTLDVELRIDRLDAEKEPVAAGQREARQVEDRVIRHRQTVEREHAEHARQRRGEN